MADSNTFIQELKSKLDIVSVVGDYVSLQRKGRDYWGCCPFHHEKTPSFQVSAFHQYYTCFGCGKKGDAINFVMEMDRLTFSETIEKLASRVGLEVPERAVDTEYKKRKEKLEKIYAINRETALFYHKNLKKNEGKIALDYLEKREISYKTACNFGIGYSTDYNSLVEHLKSLGYAVETMKEAGVVGVTEQGKPYDFFAKRLTIPIISAQNKVIGFTARSLEKNPEHAKYKNTYATLAFNKGRNIFGVNMYKKHVLPGNKAMILVEGHMDVISLFQAGITNVVASMGTALTSEQCREIKKLADIVYVSFDGDSAGQSATLKGLSLLKDEGLEVRVVQLADNLDPDDYVKKYGKEGYQKLLDTAMPLVDFKLKKIEEKYSFDSYDDRVKYLKETVSVLNSLDSVEKSVYSEKVSKISGLSLDRITAELQSTKTSENAIKSKDNSQNNKDATANNLAEIFVLSSMIFGKDYAMFGDVERDYFCQENHKKVYDYVYECAMNSTLTVATNLYEITEKGDADMIIGAMENVKIENQPAFYEQCVKKLKISYVDREIKRVINQINTEKDDNTKAELKKKLITLTQMKK